MEAEAAFMFSGNKLWVHTLDYMLILYEYIIPIAIFTVHPKN